MGNSRDIEKANYLRRLYEQYLGETGCPKKAEAKMEEKLGKDWKKDSEVDGNEFVPKGEDTGMSHAMFVKIMTGASDDSDGYDKLNKAGDEAGLGPAPIPGEGDSKEKELDTLFDRLKSLLLGKL